MAKRTLVEIAKGALSGITVSDAQIERFSVTTGSGFGLVLRATRAGFSAFVTAAADLGLTPDLNRFERIDESGEPVHYIYEMFVGVDADWREPE